MVQWKDLGGGRAQRKKILIETKSTAAVLFVVVVIKELVDAGKSMSRRGKRD